MNGGGCSVCSSPDRKAVDAAILAGASNRVIGSQFHLGHDSIRRHRLNHIPAKVAKAENIESASLMDRLKRLHGEAWSCLEAAKNSKDTSTYIQAMKRLESQLELEAKMIGLIQENQTFVFTSSVEWTAIRSVIFNVLAPYPEARVKLAEALSAGADEERSDPAS